MTKHSTKWMNRKHVGKLVLTISACMGIPTHAATNTPPMVVPAVKDWQGAEGEWGIGQGDIVIQNEDKALLPIGVLLADDLKGIGAGIHQPQNAGPNRHGIILSIDEKQTDLGDEGYRIVIDQDVSIQAKTSKGVFYGTRTLLQMLMQNAPKFTLAKGTINDKPAYSHRMLMLDVGRKPFPCPVLKDYLRIMGWYKMNELHLHLSDEAFGGAYSAFRVQSDIFPGLAARDLSYSKQDIRDLQDFAKARGITITPEIDMPGHARCFTNYWPDLMLKGYPNYLDVTNPKTIENMQKLLDEMIPLFDAPDFHIGTDEYRVGGPDKEKLHEAFRQFINTMNAHVRSRGKNMRIWSGFEHMMGTTQIDPTVMIDMWETDDAKSLIDQGHFVINSNHGRTYIVPGAHYYGVSNAGVYNSWEPFKISSDATKNPSEGDPHVLGGKLHVWNDQGPTGYTMTEIANLSNDSLITFSEKLWGTKGSKDYAEFQTRFTRTKPVPGVNIFDRIDAKDESGLVLEMRDEQTLKDSTATIDLLFAKQARTDLEYPWTMTVQVKPTAETDKRGVILSSDLAEICTNYSRTEEKKTKDADGKEVKTKVTRTGIGAVRAAGAPGEDAAAAKVSADISRVYADPIKINEWTTLTFVADKGKTILYINGQNAGQSGEQMICPLARLGSKTGNSFIGLVRHLAVYNRVMRAEEIEKLK